MTTRNNIWPARTICTFLSVILSGWPNVSLATQEDELNSMLVNATDILSHSKNQTLLSKIKSDQSVLAQSSVLLKNAKLEDAAALLQKEAESRCSPLLFIHLSKLKVRQEKEREALQTLSQAVTASRGNDELLILALTARKMQADLNAEMENYKEALLDLNIIIGQAKKQMEKKPPLESKTFSFYRGQLFYALAERMTINQAIKDYKAALLDSEELIRSFYYMSDGYTGKASALLAMGKEREAIESMKLAVAHGASPRLLANMKLKADGGDFAKSYDALTTAIKTSKDPFHCRLQRAELARKNHHLKEAQADYDLLLKDSPNDEAVLIGRAQTSMEMHDYQKAIADYSKIIYINPRHAAEAFRGRAAVYAAIGDVKRSEEDLQHAKKLD